MEENNWTTVGQDWQPISVGIVSDAHLHHTGPLALLLGWATTKSPTQLLGCCVCLHVWGFVTVFVTLVIVLYIRIG